MQQNEEQARTRLMLYLGAEGVDGIEAIIKLRGYNPRRDHSLVARQAIARELAAAKRGEPAVQPKTPRAKGVRP